jgi:hypothetical protein
MLYLSLLLRGMAESHETVVERTSGPRKGRGHQRYETRHLECRHSISKLSDLTSLPHKRVQLPSPTQAEPRYIHMWR